MHYHPVAWHATNPFIVSRYVERTPLRRMGREEDFKGAIAFLASDLSDWVTGQNIMVDGGWEFGNSSLFLRSKVQN